LYEGGIQYTIPIRITSSVCNSFRYQLITIHMLYPDESKSQSSNWELVCHVSFSHRVVCNFACSSQHHDEKELKPREKCSWNSGYKKLNPFEFLLERGYLEAIVSPMLPVPQKRSRTISLESPFNLHCSSTHWYSTSACPKNHTYPQKNLEKYRIIHHFPFR
jgi:hypothetical protein